MEKGRVKYLYGGVCLSTSHLKLDRRYRVEMMESGRVFGRVVEGRQEGDSSHWDVWFDRFQHRPERSRITSPILE